MNENVSRAVMSGILFWPFTTNRMVSLAMQANRFIMLRIG
jgi:hypothetical protein